MQQPNLIQQKIKKMIESKKRLAKKQQQGDPSTMVHHPQSINNHNHVYKGNGDEQYESSTSQNEINKLSKYNLNKRASSVRYIPESTAVIPGGNDNSSSSVNAHHQQKVDINVKEVLDTVFQYGNKLKEYLKSVSLDLETTKIKVFGNQIFMLSLNSKLAQVSLEKHSDKAEKQIILKLQKIKAIQNQQLSCKLSEQKITSLIEKRLRQLNKY